MSDRTVRALWVAGHHFDPPDMGIFRYSRDVAEALGDAGVSCRFVGHRRDGGGVTEAPGWRIVGPASRSPRKLVSRLPFKVAEVWDRPFREAVAAELAARPDVVVLDHLRVGAVLDLLPPGTPAVYMSQNHETSLKEASVHGAGSPVHALLQRWDLRKLAGFEQRLCDRAALVTAITAEDAATFRRRNGVPEDKLMVLPPIYRGQRVPSRTMDAGLPRRVVVLNNLAWAEKRRDTEELFAAAAEPFRAAGIELVLVGGGVPDSTRERFPWVQYAGFVDDLAAFLATCRIGVVFETVGGGLKMKALDYVANRVPIVASAGALAGIPLADGDGAVERADAAATVAACVDLIDDVPRLQALADRAAEACADSFRAEIVGRAFADRLAGLVGA